MKGKFSLNRLLHNKRLIIFFSIISAVAVWAAVHNMSSSEITTISKNVNLSLKGTYAGNSGMKIFSDTTVKVNITVKGSWFVINRLTDNNITVTGDYTRITGYGIWDIDLIPSKNIFDNDYTIESITPRSTEIFCDYVGNSSVVINADISGVKIDESTGYQLGTPVIQGSGIENSKITVEGPKSVVNSIASITAKIDEPKTISEVTTFSASLTAFDKNGKKVNTDMCSFVGLKGKNKVNVTVPVQERRTIKLKCDLENTPNGISNMRNFVTISPSAIDIVGTPEQVNTFTQDIATIGTFNFNHLSLKDTQKKILLNIPQGIRVIDGTTEVTVSFHMDSFISKTLDMTLSSKNTLVISKPVDRSWSLAAQKIRVTLIGNKSSVNKIKASDLSAIIDMAGENTTGVREFRAIIRIKGYDDVWVYYGKTEPSGYIAYMTVR